MAERKTVKKTTGRKAKAAAMNVDLILEYAGQQFSYDMLKECMMKKIKELFPDREVKKVGVYLQPEMDLVYYTLDGEGSPDWCFLFDELQPVVG